MSGSISRFFLLLAVLVSIAAPAAEKARDPLQGTTSIPGYFDVWTDPAKGRVLLGVREFGQPFLLVTSLPAGLGSNDVGLDRGQPGNVHLVEFRRAGPRLLLVERTTRYIASADSAAERAAVRDAFAESVMWAGDILRSGDDAERAIVDISSLLVSDQHGIAERLEATKQGKYTIDKDRSVALPDASRSFRDNTELEALLTFTGGNDGTFVRQVAANPTALTLRQHISLVRLPPPGFRPRAFHPGSGGFSIGAYDFSQPIDASLDVRWQPRFRLVKTDPLAAVSTVVEPIVFYVDPATPEPVRSALLDGANWWRTAFEKAGFKDAFRAELLPPDADPMDIRYNVILWVHRATRGWSYGSALIDPRTGEIIKGAVTLGSQRVRQDILIAESLLAPYDKADPAPGRAQAQQMALARLRQLAAHEVGHALGFAHNFAASRHGNGSVMDYPHPLLKFDTQGAVSLDDAYGVGIGHWDEFLVRHAYSEFAPDLERTGLAALRDQAHRDGLDFVSDADARAPGASHADGLLWDFGAGTLDTFDRLLAVRRKALDGFSLGVLPPQRQLGEIEARLVPVYLLHRYQVEAVARLLGGSTYRYGLAADTPAGSAPVSPDQQRQALARIVRTLTAEELALPNGVLDLMTPPGNEYERTPEYFATRSAPMFDPVSAVEAAVAHSLQFLLEPARLNRVAWQNARDPRQPGIGEVFDALFRATWQHDIATPERPGSEMVQLAADWVVLDAVFGVIEGGQLHPGVEADLRAHLTQWRHWFVANTGAGSIAASRREAARLIAAYLADPRTIKIRPLPPIPPGAPI